MVVKWPRDDRWCSSASRKSGRHIIVSDDGLQHYALEREIEIAILDGERGSEMLLLRWTT